MHVTAWLVTCASLIIRLTHAYQSKGGPVCSDVGNSVRFICDSFKVPSIFINGICYFTVLSSGDKSTAESDYCQKNHQFKGVQRVRMATIEELTDPQVLPKVLAVGLFTEQDYKSPSSEGGKFPFSTSSSTARSVCAMVPDRNCPTGFTLNTRLNKCVSDTVEDNVDFEKAKESCKGKGGSLPVLHNDDQAYGLAEFGQNKAPQGSHIWLGSGYNDGKQSSIYFESGSKIDYFRWKGDHWKVAGSRTGPMVLYQNNFLANMGYQENSNSTTDKCLCICEAPNIPGLTTPVAPEIPTTTPATTTTTKSFITTPEPKYNEKECKECKDNKDKCAPIRFFVGPCADGTKGCAYVYPEDIANFLAKTPLMSAVNTEKKLFYYDNDVDAVADKVSAGFWPRPNVAKLLAPDDANKLRDQCDLAALYLHQNKDGEILMSLRSFESGYSKSKLAGYCVKYDGPDDQGNCGAKRKIFQVKAGNGYSGYLYTSQLADAIRLKWNEPKVVCLGWEKPRQPTHGLGFADYVY